MPQPRPVITFDPAKSAWNAHERGMPFTMAERFDFTTALIREDDREDYGEVRLKAFGRIGREVVCLVFTRSHDGFRVISLRKATKLERTLWHARSL